MFFKSHRDVNVTPPSTTTDGPGDQPCPDPGLGWDLAGHRPLTHQEHAQMSGEQTAMRWLYTLMMEFMQDLKACDFHFHFAFQGARVQSSAVFFDCLHRVNIQLE